MMTLLWVVALSFTPTVELNGSIPYAMFVGEWPWWFAWIVGVLANTALAPFVWFFVDHGLELLLKIPFLKKLYDTYAAGKGEALQPYVDRYGVWGVAAFIALPGPGSGIYSAGLAARLLNFRFADFMRASFLGNLMAGAIITAAAAAVGAGYGVLKVLYT